MSQPGQEPARPGRNRPACELCIYGSARWYVEYSWNDDLWEQEREVCDRCLADLQTRQERDWLNIWVVEEA